MWVQEQALISLLPGVAFLVIFIDVGAFFAMFSPYEDLFLPCEGLSATFFFNWEIFFVFMEGIFATFLYVGAFFPLLRLFLLDGAFLLPFCPYEGPFLGLPLPPLQKFLRAPMYTPPHTI